MVSDEGEVGGKEGGKGGGGYLPSKQKNSKKIQSDVSRSASRCGQLTV